MHCSINYSKRIILNQRPRIYNCIQMNNYLLDKKYNVVLGSHSVFIVSLGCLWYRHIREQHVKSNFQAIFLHRCKPSLCRSTGADLGGGCRGVRTPP